MVLSSPSKLIINDAIKLHENNIQKKNNTSYTNNKNENLKVLSKYDKNSSSINKGSNDSIVESNNLPPLNISEKTFVLINNNHKNKKDNIKNVTNNWRKWNSKTISRTFYI